LKYKDKNSDKNYDKNSDKKTIVFLASLDKRAKLSDIF
jgi:hypothetical protein